tara:strand:+ start:37 stop:933 length:897 start_codon:yes stop_codon:yes gene_type:complete
MDYNEAIKILEISQKHTQECIRRAYHKMALKHHPDKGGDPEKFKKVLEAKNKLMNQFRKVPNEDINYQVSFSDLLAKLLKQLAPDVEWDSIFIDTTLNEILKGCHNISLKVFSRLKKDRAIKIYEILSKYNEIFCLRVETINSMKEIIKEKMKDDNIIILQPKIKDLMSDKIYKLELGNTIHYVPLWHNELYFDVSNNDLIVQIIPDIDNGLVIGPNNDVAMDYQLHILDAFTCNVKNIYIGGEKFTINTNELKLTDQKQVFTFKNRGLLRINTNDIFDNSNRGDVFIAIKLYFKQEY